MKIGISMDAYRKAVDPVTAVRKLADIGFQALDFNFSDYREGSVLSQDNWKDIIMDIKNAANSANIEFSQLHSPFYMIIDNNEHAEFEEMMTPRSFEACQILDCKWAVIHSKRYEIGMSNDNYEQTKSYNISRVKRLCKQAKEFGISIALENIFRFSEELKNSGINQTTDIIETIDNAGCDNLGVCFDTGHAFYEGIEPADAAKQYGDRLRVLHIHDNSGKYDQHVAPFVGNINWNEFMKSLNEIKFQGVFSLEIHNYVQRMPVELIDDAVRMGYKIAKHLVNIKEKKI